MAEPGPRIVSINELRFRPANSNDRARAGMEHAFKEVPDCAFGKYDGISPYMAADAGIKDFPDTPVTQPSLNGDVPEVAQLDSALALTFGQKLLRDGFALAIFLHVVVFGIVIMLVSIPMPEEALLEGETVVAVEFFSDTDSEVTTRIQREESDGEEEAVEEVKEEVKVEPKQEVVKPVEEPIEKPRDEPKLEVAKPVEQAKLPEPVEKPVEKPVEQPVVVTDEPEVLSTTQPSDFQIEQAARQILEDTKIEPLPDTPPPMLITPVEEEKPEPEKKLVQPLSHPVSKPRVVEKVAEVKPVEQPVVKKEEPKPVLKKEEPKPVEKKPEPKKVEPKKEEAKKPAPKPKKEVRKKTERRDGNAQNENDKGSSTAKNKKGESREASKGDSKSKLKGNSSKSNYNGLLVRKLERAKRRVANPGKGKLVVAFTINANGSVSNLRIKQSSGKPALDKAALEIVRKASPFPPIPDEMNVSSLPRTVPMTFK